MKKHLKNFQRWTLRLMQDHVEKVFRVYPPYVGAGIRVREISADFRKIRVEMPLTPLNANYVGTHFGGSLYSMCDPFYMLMLIENLGPDYIVWDKAATIRFRRPGKGLVTAEFRLTEEQIEAVRTAADRDEKVEPCFQVEIRDKKGELIAEVEKTLYVRRKK